MAVKEYQATPAELRRFVVLQVGLIGGFLALLWAVLKGTDDGAPPLWSWLALAASLGIAAFLAERVWLATEPLDPHQDPAVSRDRAVAIFAGQTVRRLIITAVPLLVIVLATLVLDAGAYFLLGLGVPALGLVAFETWPSLRHAANTAAVLDARGATSDLIRAFV